MPLQFEQMQDQLRRLTLRLDALERAVPSGRGLLFDSELLINPGRTFPDSVIDGNYIRMNNLLIVWFVLTWQSAGDFLWTTSSLSVTAPYNLGGVLQGSWEAYAGGTSFPTAVGPMRTVADGFPYVTFSDGVANGGLVTLSNSGITMIDFDASVVAGSTQLMEIPWQTDDLIIATFVARIPDES